MGGKDEWDMQSLLQRVPKILVVLSTVQKARRDKLYGILRYAKENGPWNVQMLENHPFETRFHAFQNWQPDGVICDSSIFPPDGYAQEEQPEAIFRHLAKLRVPFVLLDVSPDSSIRRCSRVDLDSAQTSNAVADAFLKQGLRHLAFVGANPDVFWSRDRQEAFSRRAAEAGVPLAVYSCRYPEDWGLECMDMGKWLCELPKPCGIMAAMDIRARQVLDACVQAGVSIPGEIRIIGVDNDETICENTDPSLSSVCADFEGGGYLAASVLHRMMLNPKSPPVRLSYGVKQVVERLSSMNVNTLNGIVTRAVEFIRLNACAGIGVTDVAKAIHVSRRYAEIHFREACGYTIHEAILRQRLDRVCLLLRDTSQPIGEIGERCGFRVESYLKTLFKSRFGCTMSQYRKSERSGVGNR